MAASRPGAPLAGGVTGPDVSQLNHDLVALGDANRADVAALGWDYFSWATAAGVQKLQSALGVAFPSGWLPLGSVVFEPRALRVSQVAVTLPDGTTTPGVVSSVGTVAAVTGLRRALGATRGQIVRPSSAVGARPSCSVAGDGAAAGLLPAIRAARLQPTEALWTI